MATAKKKDIVSTGYLSTFAIATLETRIIQGNVETNFSSCGGKSVYFRLCKRFRAIIIMAFKPFSSS